MNIDFEEWFKKILAVQKRFNKSNDPVERFAILSALHSEFQAQVKWMGEEAECLRDRAVDKIIGK